MQFIFNGTCCITRTQLRHLISPIKRTHSWHFELFCPRTDLSLNGTEEPENSSLQHLVGTVYMAPLLRCLPWNGMYVVNSKLLFYAQGDTLLEQDDLNDQSTLDGALPLVLKRIYSPLLSKRRDKDVFGIGWMASWW